MKKFIFKLLKILIRVTVHMKAIALYWFCKEKENVIKEYKKDISKSNKIAIIAMWQKNLCLNFENLLKILNDNGYECFIINNCKIHTSSLEKMVEYSALYIERSPGYGRDIGAYKLGVKILNKIGIEKSPANKVLFLNDSVFYLRENFLKFLTEFEAVDESVVGVTETLEKNYHISSWFFSVSKFVFLSNEFQKFWDNYRPYQSRVHSINRGEIGLSTLYREMGIAPFVIFTTDRILSVIENNSLSTEEVYLCMPDQIKPKFTLKGKIVDRYVMIYKLCELSTNYNQTYYWGMVLLTHFNFPFVKKEIYSRELYNLTQIRKGLHSRSSESEEVIAETNYIVSKLISRKTVREEGIFRRLLILSGVL